MPMSQEQYLHLRGRRCPMCRSDNIVYGEFPVESSTSQFIYCEDCGAEWYDEYTLTGYSLTAEGAHENERAHGEPGEVLQVDRNNSRSWVDARPQTPTREDVRQLAEELRSQREQLHMNGDQALVWHNWQMTFDGRHLLYVVDTVSPHVVWKEEEEEEEEE